MNSPELPPCFKSWCDQEHGGCGWLGRRRPDFVYVVGANYPISAETPDVGQWAKCPKCKRERGLRRLADRVTLAQRFAWAANHFGKDPGRPCVQFPCSCAHAPPCRVVGDIEVKKTTVGDTCFGGYDPWLRVSAPVKCNGCHAPTTLAVVERHNWRDLELFDEVTGNYLKAWEV